MYNDNAFEFFKITLEILKLKNVISQKEYDDIQIAINNMQAGEFTSNLYIYIRQAISKISEV